jgi:hypothetical protein
VKSNSAMMPTMIVSIKLQLFAKADVKRARAKERQDDSDEDEVAHV